MRKQRSNTSQIFPYGRTRLLLLRPRVKYMALSRRPLFLGLLWHVRHQKLLDAQARDSDTVENPQSVFLDLSFQVQLVILPAFLDRLLSEKILVKLSPCGYDSGRYCMKDEGKTQPFRSSTLPKPRKGHRSFSFTGLGITGTTWVDA